MKTRNDRQSMSLEERWARIACGRRSDPGARVARALLTGLALAHRAGLEANLWLYRSELKQRTRPALPTVSVGNISLGGAGKSTAVKRLAQELLREGLTPGIVLRGYGRRSRRGAALVCPSSAAEQVGDEALMLAQALPGCPVAVGKRRERAIALLAQTTPAQMALLDDGFQYFRLDKLADVVLVDALAVPSCQRLFPAGYLREPPPHLQRASQVWLTHCDQASAEQLRWARAFVAQAAPALPLVTTRHRPTLLRPISQGAGAFEGTGLSLDGAVVVALCALGNPRSFEASVADLGAAQVIGCRFPDHHRFSARDLERVAQLARSRRADLVVTTHKDAVRLPAAPAGCPILVLECELEILSGREHLDALIALIRRAVLAEQTP